MPADHCCASGCSPFDFTSIYPVSNCTHVLTPVLGDFLGDVVGGVLGNKVHCTIGVLYLFLALTFPNAGAPSSTIAPLRQPLYLRNYPILYLVLFILFTLPGSC